MLTKDLLEVEKRKPNIRPQFRNIEEYADVAQEVIDRYESGKTRGEIEAEINDLETHDTFKLVRALSKLLDRRSTFEQRTAAPPASIRREIFEHGFVTSDAAQDRVLEEVSDTFGVTADEVERSMWADRDSEAVLTKPPDIEPGALLRQYNLSLAQTLLFDARELVFTVSNNYQEIFGRLTYLGLMYTVDSELNVTVNGPASLFKKTRKYGTELAKLLPIIMKADSWDITAQVETEVSDETRVYEFSLDDSAQELFPARTATESFDSDVERDFATRISSLAEGWSVTREPTILRAGNRVMIPDFSFKRNDHEFYLEVVGFWTPEYLEEKLEKVRDVESEVPLMLAVNDNLRCTKDDFSGADSVFFYEERIPVKPVMARLQHIEEQRVERDLESLREAAIDLPADETVHIPSLAEELEVEPGALTQHIEATHPGYISNETYVPEAVGEEIRSEIGRAEHRRLSDINPILERYEVGQALLEKLGYEITYTSLRQDEATVEKSEN